MPGSRAVYRGFQQVTGDAWSDDELRTRHFGGFEHVTIEHGASTGAQFRALFTQYLNGLEAELGTQGHFQCGQTTGCQGIGQRQDVLLAGDGDHRQDPRLGAEAVDQGNFIRHGHGRLRAFHSG